VRIQQASRTARHAAHSRLAALPDSGVRWANVAAVWNEMEQRGLLQTRDRDQAAEARRRAAAERP